MAHGTNDPLIPLARARHAYDLLTSLGYRIEWHEYPIPHSVSRRRDPRHQRVAAADFGLTTQPMAHLTMRVVAWHSALL